MSGEPIFPNRRFSVPGVIVATKDGREAELAAREESRLHPEATVTVTVFDGGPEVGQMHFRGGRLHVTEGDARYEGWSTL